MEELFRDYWWLIFPIFGMVLAVWGMISSDRRQRAAMETLRLYAQQGKEPPPELIRAALADDDGLGLAAEFGLRESKPSPGSRNTDRAWTFVVCAAIAAGFAVGWWWVRDQDFAFAFLIVAVTMGVLALGALGILIFGRKS